MITVQLVTTVRCPLSLSDIQQAVAIAARYEKKINSSVEIHIVGNQAIQTLNRQYRGFNKPTDVLSFSFNEDATFQAIGLGQIYLSYPYIVRQAKRFKVSPKEEFFRMLTHGLLHLVGHDHHETAEAEIMFALQEKIVTAIFKTKK